MNDPRQRTFHNLPRGSFVEIYQAFLNSYSGGHFEIAVSHLCFRLEEFE